MSAWRRPAAQCSYTCKHVFPITLSRRGGVHCVEREQRHHSLRRLTPATFLAAFCTVHDGSAFRPIPSHLLILTGMNLERTPSLACVISAELHNVIVNYCTCMQVTNHVVRHAGRSQSVHHEPPYSSVYLFSCKKQYLDTQSNVA